MGAGKWIGGIIGFMAGGPLNSLEAAYKVLEILPTATDEEVRAAYRKLVLKHHPDRVATLGEDIKRAAEEKLQDINNAKEIIYKARGIK